eukprot:6184171-Pleurochrysis_carterae.AAC.1
MSHQWLGDAFPDPENVHYDMILTAAVTPPARRLTKRAFRHEARRSHSFKSTRLVSHIFRPPAQVLGN